jgi:uncharacterized membrane protein
VIAIIITIMVLELKPPHVPHFAGLKPLLPGFLIYILSFIYVAIYWNNHHHLFHAVERIGGGVLWANAHLLFWLSLIPFVTAWMAENHFARASVALYGVILLCCAGAYFILTRVLLRHHEHDSALAQALGRDRKGKVSVLLYAMAIAMAFVLPWVSSMIYVVVAILWLVPDARIEKKVEEDNGGCASPQKTPGEPITVVKQGNS